MRPWNISRKAVLLGALTDLGQTLVGYISLTIYVVLSNAEVMRLLKARDEQGVSEAIRRALDNNAFLETGGVVVGCIASVMGGYVSGRIAKREEVLHGALAGTLPTLLSLLPVGGAPWHDSSFLTWLLGICSGPALGGLGGFTRVLKTRYDEGAAEDARALAARTANAVTSIGPMPASYSFREARHGDERRIQHIVDAVLREYGMAIELDDIDRDLIDIQASYVSQGGTFRVLVDNTGQLLGCGALHPLDAETVELRKMYFLPVARGQGLGRAMLQSLVDTARAIGYKRVTLETQTVLRDAIALYERFGFAEQAHERCGSRCDRAYELTLG